MEGGVHVHVRVVPKRACWVIRRDVVRVGGPLVREYLSEYVIGRSLGADVQA